MPKSKKILSGVTLRQAADHFCPGELRTKHDAEIAELGHGLRNAFKASGLLRKAVTIVAAPFVAVENTQVFADEKKAHVRNCLRNGVLQATGINSGARGPKTRRIIPADYFSDPAILWSENALESLGQRFDSVEVIAPTPEPVKLPAKTKQIQSAKQKGRPSNRHEIREVISYLDSIEYDFNSKSRKVSVAEIKRVAVEQYGFNIDRNYGIKTIESAINDFLAIKNRKNAETSS